VKDVNSPRIPVKRVNLSINMEETGKNLKKLISENGYSVKDIMEITGISSEQAIYKWYHGKSIPSTEVQLILQQALGKRVDEILVIDGDYYFFVFMYKAYHRINAVSLNQQFSIISTTKASLKKEMLLLHSIYLQLFRFFLKTSLRAEAISRITFFS